jgi:hypothetical protein
MDGSGVMLVRVWLQNDELVARIRWSVSGEADQHAEVVVGADQIERTLRRWLREIAAPLAEGS